VADLALSGHYLHEKADSKHRMGDLLATAWISYDQLRNPEKYPDDHIGKDPKFATLRSSAHRLGFYDWLDSVPEFQRVTLIGGHVLMRSHGRNRTVAPGGAFGRGDVEQGNLLPSMVVAFLKGVAYLDAMARRAYELEFPGGFPDGRVFFVADGVGSELRLWAYDVRLGRTDTLRFPASEIDVPRAWADSVIRTRTAHLFDSDYLSPERAELFRPIRFPRRCLHFMRWLRLREARCGCRYPSSPTDPSCGG
jgi:hypothetical protein